MIELNRAQDTQTSDMSIFAIHVVGQNDHLKNKCIHRSPERGSELGEKERLRYECTSHHSVHQICRTLSIHPAFRDWWLWRLGGHLILSLHVQPTSLGCTNRPGDSSIKYWVSVRPKSHARRRNTERLRILAWIATLRGNSTVMKWGWGPSELRYCTVRRVRHLGQVCIRRTARMCRGLRHEDILLRNRTCKRRQTIFHDWICSAREDLMIYWDLNSAWVEVEPSIQSFWIPVWTNEPSSSLAGWLVGTGIEADGMLIS